ncbi:MAG: UbiX family flavin prenyltransferase [Bacteroidetes bacterium]|nr:UbiX family flavin prenyltransferase [Bacteroidota bacterium]MCL5737577.1 UbiX family flavin prenyltransferase [Bacteroidota bacterium]
MSENKKKIIVGITGASGAIYALHTVRALLVNGVEVHFVISDYGAYVIESETDFSLKNKSLIESFREKFGDAVLNGAIVKYSNRDLAASLSSGSFKTDGMVIVPCSMKTLAGVAQGIAGSLIERSADVTLKEGRKLVLVPRETPLNKIHLKNMLAASDAGAHILPAMPAFYQKPSTIEELADFIAGRILALFNIEAELFEPWQK